MARSVSIEGVPIPTGNRKKPRRLVRGRRLKAVVSALQGLRTMMAQDTAESTRATAKGYTPFLILGAANSPARKAYTTLFAALTAAQAATA